MRRNAVDGRSFSRAPLFNPEAGVTVVEPPGSGPGWWAGACSVEYDARDRKVYLYYRVRKPRDLGRGTDCYVAVSDDGERFETIWHASKEQFASESVERGCLLYDGDWLLYVSYVDPVDRRWRTDVMQADRPDGFDPQKRQCVFRAADIGAEGVKDPVVYRVGSLYYGFFSYAPTPVAPDREAMHATGDVYNTGITKSHTGLALSADGLEWQWQGDVLSPSDLGWDAYCARLSCLVPTAHGFVAFYDCSASVAENYEERTGLAHAFDLRRFDKAPNSPYLISAEGSMSLRYMDAVRVGDELLLYYEYCRADGSHELRMNRVPAHA